MFWVLLQEDVDSCSFFCVYVMAEDSASAKVNATLVEYAEDYPIAVYLEHAGSVQASVDALRKALARNPHGQAFWCLVKDEDDNSFHGVEVTAKDSDSAAIAAVNRRKRKIGFKEPGDCGFKVVLTHSLARREQLLAHLSKGELNAPLPINFWLHFMEYCKSS